MSALPPKADMCSATRDVRFVPIADITPLIRSPRRRAPISVGGTLRPSALAVLRLITSSYLVGACTGRSAGLLALEDAIDIVGGAPKIIAQVSSVGQ